MLANEKPRWRLVMFTQRWWKQLLLLALLVVCVKHILWAANMGVDGSNVANTLTQCVYRSYRYTGNYVRKLSDPYDDKLLSCDEDHQFSMFHATYPTDKCGRHTYLPKYEPHFRKIRDSGKRVSLLEIGVKNGGSLMLWRAYFPFDALIYGLDVNQGAPQFQYDPAINILYGDSRSAKFDYFEKACLDVIIDDGDHLLTAQIQTFSIWFDKYLCPGGVYVVEDVLDSRTIDRKSVLIRFLTEHMHIEYESFDDPSGESMFIVSKPTAKQKYDGRLFEMACAFMPAACIIP